MTALRVIFTMVVSLAFFGCSRKDADLPKTQFAELEKLSDAAVIISVNGHDATKHDLEEVRKLRKVFYQLVKKDDQKTNHAENLDKLDAVAIGTFAGNMIRDTIINEAIAAYTKKNGEFDESVLQEARKRVLSKYTSTLASAGITFKKFQRHLEDVGMYAYFAQTVTNEFRQEAFLASAFTNRYVITSNVVANVYSEIEIHNRLAAETNKTIAATYNAVLAALDAGQDFAELADKYSMDPDKDLGGDIGECVERDFADEPELWKAIQVLSPGEHTPVVAASDSYQIVKLIDKIPAEKAQSREDSLHLARIYFRRADLLPRYDEVAVIETLEKDRRKRIVTEIIEKALLTADIKFPSGENVIPRESADFYLDRANELKAEIAVKEAANGKSDK